MIESAVIKHLEGKIISSRRAAIKEQIFNKDVFTVNIPAGWWISISSFDIITPKTTPKIYKLDSKNDIAANQKSLPRTKYWEIRQGDYRSKAEQSKMLDRRKNRRRNQFIELSLTTLISTVIVLLISYLIAGTI